MKLLVLLLIVMHQNKILPNTETKLKFSFKQNQKVSVIQFG